MSAINAIYNANVYIDGNSLLGNASEFKLPEFEFGQDDQCAGTVTLVGNALLVAGQMVRLQGFGKFSGKYLVKQSRHAFTRHRGWTTELEIKMTEYVADEEQADANANPNP